MHQTSIDLLDRLDALPPLSEMRAEVRQAHRMIAIHDVHVADMIAGDRANGTSDLRTAGFKAVADLLGL